MKRKVLSILFAVVLVAGLGLVTAVPAAAQEEILQVLPYTLEATNTPTTATSTWSTAEYHTGSSSVELDLDDGNTEYAEVAFALPGGITLAEINLATTSFWCYSTAGNHIPYFTFELTPFGVWENSFRINNDAHSSTGFTGDFAQFVASSTTPEWQWYEVSSDGQSFDASGWETWDNLVAQYGTAVVTGVYVGISGLDANVYTSYVDDITVNGTTYYGQIQDAIDSATATTVTVAPGVYSGDAVTPSFPLVIDEAGMTLQSDSGAAVTTIDGETNAGIIEVRAADVTIGGTGHGFTIQNSGAPSPTGFDTDYGILVGCGYTAPDVLIQDNIIKVKGNGVVLLSGADSTAGTAQILDNEFHTGWDAVRTADLPGCNVVNNVVISGNTVLDVNYDIGGGYMGFVLESAANVLVDNNTVTGGDASLYICANPGASIGETVTVANFTITNNTFTGPRGIELYVGSVPSGGIAGPCTISNVTISGNTLTGTGSGTEHGIRIYQAADGAIANILIDNNQISNYGSPPEGKGIWLTCYDGGEIVDEVIISNNNIFENDWGIRLDECVSWVQIIDNCIVNNFYDGILVKGSNNVIGTLGHGNVISKNGGDGVHLTTTAFGNVINYNDIVFNSSVSYGVYNANFVPTDATNNWWGNPNGPGAAAFDSYPPGDTVSNYVIYDPWLSAPAVDSTAPIITYSAASPSMVSLWSDDMFWSMWGCNTNYSVGPSCYTMFSVKATDDRCGMAMVTINKKDLLLALIPQDKLDKFVAELQPGVWESYLAWLESIEMGYHEEYGCWHEGECLCAVLAITLMGILNVTPIEAAEIMGQELILGDHQIEVTVYDYSGNSTTDYIDITIVDFQMPVCEGWNLRSTWLDLENNKWQDILATMDHDGEGWLLRWNPLLGEKGDWQQYDAGLWLPSAEEEEEEALMAPLEAYWIYSPYNDQFGLITFRGVSAPPSRQLYAGWNLIGTALAWHQPGLRVDDALMSIYEGEEHCTGYTQVLSIDQSNWWAEKYYICGTYPYDYPCEGDYCWCDGPSPPFEGLAYHKCFWQDTWVYTRRGNPDGPPPPPVTRGGGYWVFQQNPAVLAGYNSTPLPVEFWFQWLQCGD